MHIHLFLDELSVRNNTKGYCKWATVCCMMYLQYPFFENICLFLIGRKSKRENILKAVGKEFFI